RRHEGCANRCVDPPRARRITHLGLRLLILGERDVRYADIAVEDGNTDGFEAFPYAMAFDAQSRPQLEERAVLTANDAIPARLKKLTALPIEVYALMRA